MGWEQVETAITGTGCGGGVAEDKMTKLEEIARAIRERWDNPTGEGIDMSVVAARAAVEALREPGEGVKVKGVMALTAKMESQQKWWEEPAQQARDLGDTPVMPTISLALRNSRESDAVWQAMLTSILEEG